MKLSKEELTILIKQFDDCRARIRTLDYFINYGQNSLRKHMQYNRELEEKNIELMEIYDKIELASPLFRILP